jgi:replication-associated recombination protein RarA
MPSDPWASVRTAHGFAADEVISALQKEIRRGHAENAAVLAYEMLTTSAELEAMLWRRLMVISVEDVGWGDLNAPQLVHTLCQMAERFERSGYPPDRGLFAIHAVRYLASRPKDRSSDEMYNWIQKAVAAGDLQPAIPDYALDRHTARGQALGRGRRHFYEEAARLEPELAGRELTYRQRLLALLEPDGAADD